jgi:hypothetical protein
VICNALKLGKTFYLLAIIRWSIFYKESLDDDENHTKSHVMGIFPAVGQNLYVARSTALVLRDHAGDRQLIKQP